MKKHICLYRLSGLFAVISIIVLGGCASIHPDSALEKNWGHAYEAQLTLQTANPEAGQQVRPVQEMDGATSQTITETHRQSFAEDCDDETVNIIKLR